MVLICRAAKKILVQTAISSLMVKKQQTNRPVTIKISLKFTKISNKSDKSLENRKKSALFFHEKAKNSAVSFSKKKNFPTTRSPPPVTKVNFPPPQFLKM